MNLTKTDLEWLKEKGEHLIRLTFRARIIPLVGVIILSVIPVPFIAGLSQQDRLIFAGAFSILTMATVPYVNNMFALPAVTMIHFSIFKKKYKPREYTTDKIQRLKNEMNLSERVKVYITDNPWITGPFCIMVSGNVFLPEKWTHPEQEPFASISHEFGHIKTRRTYALEFLGGILLVVSFTLLLLQNTIPIIAQTAGFAFEMIIFTLISRRNEFRADSVGADYAGPEGLISLFEKLKHEARWDDGSETHPSYGRRLEKLYKLLE